MRTKSAALLVIALGLFSSGCTVAWRTARTLVAEPAHYPTYLEHCVLQRQTRKLAETAWQETAGAAGRAPQGCYADGFKEGYADFLQYGGNGEPPPIPPRDYWNEATPPGRTAAMEWFDGFRHGAAAAKQTGLRELIIVPASASLNRARSSTVSGSASDQPSLPLDPAEPLPLPRPVEELREPLPSAPMPPRTPAPVRDNRLPPQ
jgi:hypothetical protein